MPKNIHKVWSSLKAIDPKADADTIILTCEIDPEDESCGDIIRVDGMEVPERIPLLAQHLKHGANGEVTILGSLVNPRKSMVQWKGTPRKAWLQDIEWADTDLAKNYRKVWPKHIKDVSVGAEIIGDPVKIKGFGWDYTKTRAFEGSLVTFGANPAAESVKAIKAALGDAIEEPRKPSPEPTGLSLNEKLDAIGGGIIELHVKVGDIHSQFVSKENWNLNRFETIAAKFEQINKRLDDFECILVSKSDESEQTADSQAPQAPTADLSAILAQLSKMTAK